jgi:hypothetical protein
MYFKNILNIDQTYLDAVYRTKFLYVHGIRCFIRSDRSEDKSDRIPHPLRFIRTILGKYFMKVSPFDLNCYRPILIQPLTRRHHRAFRLKWCNQS